MARNATAASAEKQGALVAVEPVNHDGVLYMPGQPFHAGKGAAQALLDAGVAAAPGQPEGTQATLT